MGEGGKPTSPFLSMLLILLYTIVGIFIFKVAYHLRGMNMSFAELSSVVGQLVERLISIEADIAFIKSQLPPEGGLTPEEVAALKTQLDEVLAKAVQIDEQTPNEVS